MSIKTLVDSVNTVLREFEFFGDKLIWNRRLGEVIEVVDLQVSKSKGEITINCGIFHTNIYSIVWGRDWVGTAEEPLCVVRARIGELMDGHDVWWRISNEATKHSAIRALTEYCLPFLEGVRSNQEIEAYLERTALKQQYPLPKIYLAAMRVLNGKREAGCSLLSDIQKKALGDWRNRAREVSVRLGC